MAQSPHSSFVPDLHRAALMGDDEGVRLALRSGVDVNEVDLQGRNVLMCAIAGEQWDSRSTNEPFNPPLDVIRTLLTDPTISFLTLNDHQRCYRGVTPLGMAAWLNMSDVVRLLLEESSESVLVDGMDMYGTTVLMYAARDSRLEVVQTLLRHGARPDLGNTNYWTSVQFALDHPRILWICEEAVRLHRWLETQISCHTECLPHATGSKLMPYSIFEDPPLLKKSTSVPPNAIIQSVLTSDIASLHTLLFSRFESPQVKKSPVLVNLPDEKGWSPIHYCAAAHEPCIQILDTLHCAGAVVMLFTTHEGWTPLHCLAQSERKVKAHPEFVSLHRFVTHIVRDLGAPLEACDKEGETCIHIAAEKGTCMETLRLLLACDSSGTVWELPNSRGLTAMEICKAELRLAFEEDLNDIGSAPSLSRDIVGPPTSALQSTCMDDVSILENVDLSASVEQLLVTLDLASPCEIQDQLR
ncbi:ankyrin repeat-containing domain protein, partial [Mycena galericulata]